MRIKTRGRAYIAFKANVDDIQVKRVIEAITSCVASGERVLFYNFGTFECKTRKGRTIQLNKLTNKGKTESVISIPDSKIVTFKCSKQLKDKLNTRIR